MTHTAISEVQITLLFILSYKINPHYNKEPYLVNVIFSAILALSLSITQNILWVKDNAIFNDYGKTSLFKGVIFIGFSI